MLLAVFAFEFGGYLMMITVLKNQASADLRQRIETGALAESETTELTLQFSLPYPINNSSNESADAEFTHGKNSYQLVSQSLKDDTWSIVVAKDHRSARLESVLATIQENLDEEGDQKAVSSNFSLQDFLPGKIEVSTDAASWILVIPGTAYLISVNNPFISVSERPPLS